MRINKGDYSGILYNKNHLSYNANKNSLGLQDESFSVRIDQTNEKTVSC